MKARALRALLAFVLPGLLLCTSAQALAFCRATTCNPAKQTCQRDPTTQCLVSGVPLYWASDCLSISVQADGSPKAGIAYAAAEASVKRAFAAWTNVDCEGARPSLRVNVSGPVSCDTSEYSGEHRNANIVMFRENGWPYPGSEDALGFTFVRFDLEDEPGALWDTDIEVNALAEPLSLGEPQSNEVDLDSLLTHEAGHVLGFGHTLDLFATMVAGYETGTDELKSLGLDDVAAMCAAYPAGRRASSTSCEPRHGFSEACAIDQTQPAEDPGSAGCELAGAPPPATVPPLLAVLLAGWGLARRRGPRRR